MNTNNLKKSSLILCLLITFILFLSGNSYAHPGKTDANGGHYNRETGVYHYHTHTPSPAKAPKASSSKASEASSAHEKTSSASSDVASVEKELIPSKLTTSLFYASLILIALCAAALLLLYFYYTYFIKKTVEIFIFLPDTKKITTIHFPITKINIPYKKYLDSDKILYGYIGTKNGKKTIIIIHKKEWLSLISNNHSIDK